MPQNRSQRNYARNKIICTKNTSKCLSPPKGSFVAESVIVAICIRFKFKISIFFFFDEKVKSPVIDHPILQEKLSEHLYHFLCRVHGTVAVFVISVSQITFSMLQHSFLIIFLGCTLFISRDSSSCQLFFNFIQLTRRSTIPNNEIHDSSGNHFPYLSDISRESYSILRPKNTN
ncbi:unnamed protein product [Albugo candida]|uniref:Uncharacterized protein n=1 Tax=Albugo candida TaxID=65357 RepID=A0A024FWF0_9STRA|nr:unnamed protein product [Albugo candida]|eukprot:CCI11371.1 unnamed protein product [Albugo candida]